MAAVDVFGVEYTSAYTDGERVSPIASGGTVHVISDTYVFNAIESGSTVTLGAAKLPKGARIVEAKIRHGALTNSVTLALSNGTDAIIAAVSCSTAGTKYGLVGVSDTATTVEDYLVLTTGVATTAASDITVEVVVLYTFH